MVIILLAVSILILEFVRRVIEIKTGSKCISMRCFKNKNYLPKFEEIYNDIRAKYDEQLVPLASKCKAIHILRYLLYLTGTWFITSGVYISIYSNLIIGITLIALSMFLIAGGVYSEKYVNKYFAVYLEKYKELVINTYIRSINKGFGYSLRGFIDEEIYKKSYDIEPEINHYYGTDYVTGVVEGTRTLNLCELYVKQRIGKSSDIFCGLFAYFKTPYEEEMKVECENKRIKYKNIPLNMQVGIENYIKAFEKEQKLDFKLSVKSGKIFVKVYCGDILQPSAFSIENNKEKLWAYYIIIKFIVDLTGMMNTIRIKK